MKEFVGACTMCKLSIYCRDGFLDGIIDEQGKLLCFPCHDKKKSGVYTQKPNHENE